MSNAPNESPEELMARHERQWAQQKQYIRKRVAYLCGALRFFGVEKITVEFDAYGDEGSMKEAVFHPPVRDELPFGLLEELNSGWIGFRTTEVPFQPDPRKAGVSKYTLRKMVRFALDGLLSFSPMPMRAAIGAALAATACSWVFAMVATFVVAPASDPVTRAAALGLTALHGLAGGLFAGAGVLGEYMVRIYDQSKDRPGYVVKEASRPAVSHQVPRAA